MAITGGILTLFVLGHMAGNLQMFISPDQINIYADTLQNLPYGLLWIERIILLLATLIHVWMAILLTQENRAAHPEGYKIKKTVQATLASKTMGISGSIILFFIIFHLLHFTTHTVYPEFKTDSYYTIINGKTMYNVYKMMFDGFSTTWVSVFYIISMALLCLHLSHGVSSMFQSLGLRNQKWRPRFNVFAIIYAWIIFLGFISIPVSVLMAKYTPINILPS
ncbi:hypothetical protein AYO37_00340 [Opitutia bacterium SCGC AG-212-L18]|nr:hypothetical protein AYO37_00340 [Opitutae bacterium SCGC AG-212-L18]